MSWWGINQSWTLDLAPLLLYIWWIYDQLTKDFHLGLAKRPLGPNAAAQKKK